MSAVVARAPCRVDLAGGTLDIWPLGLLHPGATTVNVAVDLWQTVTLRAASRDRIRGSDGRVEEFRDRRELGEHSNYGLLAGILEFARCPPVEIDVVSAVPPGSGLGGSSALTVAVLAAICRLKGDPDPDPGRLARWARDIEARHMALPTGLQDHYPALLGGALAIRHEIGGEAIDALRIDLDDLAARMLVVHTGKSHVSAEQNWRVVRGRLDGGYRQEFDEICAAGRAAESALRAADFAALGDAMTRDWLARSRFEGVSTPEVEAVLIAATAAGAWGGKACGAGGGGCVVVVCPPLVRPVVESAMGGLGLRPLEATPTSRGLEVSSL